MMPTALITGVADLWGQQTAQSLLTQGGWRVLGLDRVHPPQITEGLDFVQADIRNPLLADLLKLEKVDVVCHLALTAHEAASQRNGDGLRQLLASCVQAGVSRVVLMSSTAVYGASPENPAFIPENAPLRGCSQGTFRPYVELEAICRAFAGQIACTILRFANIMGQTAVTPLTRLLKRPLAPILLGFDPLLQVIDERDVVAALVHAIQHEMVGAINVAAEPPLPVLRLCGLTQTVPVPSFHPLAYWGVELLRRTSLKERIPFEPDYLRYRWVADTAKMRDEWGFVPQTSADESARRFAEWKHLLLEADPLPDPLARDAERLRHTLAQREAMRLTEVTDGPRD